MRRRIIPRRWLILAVVGLCLLLLAASCDNEPARASAADTALSDLPRAESPAADDAALAQLVGGNSAFAFDLFRHLSGDANLFFSPYSVSAALAMTVAGAAGTTEAQLRESLGFSLSDDALHPAFNRLDRELASRNELDPAFAGEGFQFNVVNALWGQRDYEFQSPFLDTLAQHYGAGVRLLDFAAAPDASRQLINTWVEEQTNERIQDLLPDGSIDALTRLVLTNAIYFNAPWAEPFEEGATQIEPFTNLDNRAVDVSMMHQTESYNTSQWDGGEAIELPYNGRTLSMVLLVPEAGQFDAFTKSLTSSRFQDIVNGFSSERIALGLPKFTFSDARSLVDPLIALGIKDAFDGAHADFSRITDSEGLVISDVLHKAFVAVDEAGTEAAAATAVVFRATGMPIPPRELTIDRPFVFVIRDILTGSVLFIGQVVSMP